MSRVLLAVDVSYQSYRNSAAHPMLTSRRVFTGGLYGFFMGLGKMVRETRATDVAFCWDSKPYKRSEEYPEYKTLRKARADDELLKMHQQTLKLIREVLDGCGLESWAIPGFESDDLIAHAVAKYRHRFDRIYAASNDSDLYQLFWAGNFYVYRNNIEDLMHRNRLVDTFGEFLTPDDHVMMSALMGTHNDIAGIPKVGPVTALKAIRDPAVMRKYRDSHGDIITRNLGLIKLPHPAFPYGAELPLHTGSFNPRKLYRCLDEYDIDCTGAMVAAFEQILR